MRVCIVGLGAVGGLVGARLAESGIEVSALARGATLAAVRERGLELVERIDGQETRVRHAIDVSDDPAELGKPDLVVLAVKAQALPAVARPVRALLAPGTAVLSATNGLPWWFFHGLPGAEHIRLPSLDHDGVLAHTIPVDHVVGSVVHLSASAPAPGVVAHGAGNRLIVGEPTGEDVAGRARAVADVLRAGGFEVEVSDRIQRDIWFKLWGNMTMNPISGLTGATMDRILDDALVSAFISRCMREAAAVGERIGLPIAADPEERQAVTRKLGAARTSMLQDVERGRPVELDALLTSVVELARAVDLPTPDLDTLLGLARLHARVRGLYPEAADERAVGGAAKAGT